MPRDDYRPNEFGNTPDSDKSPQEKGEFTRAFEGKGSRQNQSDSSAEHREPAPGSITQLMGSESHVSSPAPPKRLDESRAAVPGPPSSPVDSFTKAFGDVNAFSRDPAGLSQYTFDSETGKPPIPEVTPSHSGSFTRLFGTGEGILTPSGTEEHSQSPTARDPKLSAPSRPPAIPPSSFTEILHSQAGAVPPESRTPPHSFTEEFQSAPSQPAPRYLSAPNNPSTYSARPESAERVLPPSPKRQTPPQQGFERLVGTSKQDPTPSTGATIVFNRSGSSEPEITESQAESDYTMVRRLSDLRSRKDATGVAGPAGAGVSAAPPAPPAWTPPAAPTPPQWQPPQPPAPVVMPQPPALSAPALPLQPLPLGDKLVSFLPFMLALTVINFLGLLAVLIILFATRK
jgi:hypothetical protein